MNDVEYEKARQVVKDKLAHGWLPSGNYHEDIDVKLWLPEMNAVNTTILCDRLIGKYGHGLFFIITELDCISTLNIEYQSSGFQIVDTIKNEPPEMLVLKTTPNKIKKYLFIPKRWTSGFPWDPINQKYGFRKPSPGPFWEDIRYKNVPTASLQNYYILNFSVSGEFGLEIIFVPEKGEEPFLIFQKSYCCK